MEHEKHTFAKAYSGYVDEIITPCKVYALSGCHMGCEAIWDTGADHSVISRNVAEKLSLRVVSKAIMYHAAGDNIVNTYNVFIGLKDEMIIGPVNVLEGNFDGDIILLGMDIIGSGDLVVTNNNEHTEMAFSIPSSLNLDDIRNLL